MYHSEFYKNVVAVTNRSLCERPFLEQIERVCACHPKALILREKDLSEEEYFLLAKEVLGISDNIRFPASFILMWRQPENWGIPVSICHYFSLKNIRESLVIFRKQDVLYILWKML